MDILPYAERWGRLRVVFIWFGVEDRDSEDTSDELRIWDLQGLHAPLLKELCIESGFNRRDTCDLDWTLWNTPQLRRIRTILYFPHSLPGLANVTNLDLTLHVNDKSVKKILKEVSKMGCLQDVTLVLKAGLIDYETDIVPHEKLELPVIQRLRIKTELPYSTKDTTSACKRSWFSSLFFPGVFSLNLKLSAPNRKDMDTGVDGNYFNKEITRIFRHVDQFPQVVNFHLQIFSPDGDIHDSTFVTKLSIPLNMLPNVKHFTLKSNMRLDIEEPDDPDEIHYEAERRIAPRVIGEAFPVLETITLDMPDASVAADWVEGYLESLKDHGEWDRFRELVVIEGDKLDVDGCRTASYVGYKALDWCRRRNL